MSEHSREYRSLSVTVEAGVTWMTFDRPDDANALDQALIEEFEEVVDRAIADPDCHVFVMRGSGRFFCAGGDVTAMAAAPDPHAMILELAQTMHRGVLALAESRLVVIAAVHGPAAGAGLGFVLNADLVLASPGASFVAAYAGVGLTPDCGVTFLLPQVIGPRRAARMLYEGYLVKAAEALDWGLVGELAEDDAALDARVRELARSIADSATHALGPTRRMVNGSLLSGYAQQLDDEARSIAELVRHPASAATIADFAERSRARRAAQEPSDVK